jgi:hypothetical protein
MKLEFANWRGLRETWEVWQRNARPQGSHEGRTLCAIGELSPRDRRQLETILERKGVATAPFVLDALFTHPFPLRNETELFDLPIEWWDLVDEDGQPHMQLWLYNADCGTLFVSGKGDVTEVGYVAQWTLHFWCDVDLATRASIAKLWADASRETRHAIASAHERAAQKHPSSELHEVRVRA